MISILDDQFSALNFYVEELKPSKIFILCDENTHEYCVPQLLGNFETDIPLEIIEIEAGESLKNIQTATQLWEILAEFEADRKALLINVGGGVVTDMGGFVASTYKRGIKFIHLPTTLLSMCDASIGGKTGIDLGFLKNIVGTFAMPERIFVSADFLWTLPYTELRSGFAEMLKHGLIADEKHWKELTAQEKITPEILAPFIQRSMEIKTDVVEKDFREKSIRKNLNFGHTIGHAIEGLFLKKGQTIPHGEAVALGIICESRLSFLENLIPEKVADHISECIGFYFPKLDITDFSDADILSLMMNDKKNETGRINFSLIDDIGHGIYDFQASTDNIIKSLEYYKSL